MILFLMLHLCQAFSVQAPLSEQAVLDFHSQWRNRLCHSISFQTPWTALAGDHQPLTIQPYDQAGDQP